MRGCSAAGLDNLRHWRVRSPQGRAIYSEGDPANAFYRVESGCVRLQKYRGDGQRVILTFCSPGDIFGVDAQGPREAGAEAASNCELSRFPLDQDFDGGVREVLSASAQMVGELGAHLMALSHASAEDRLTWFLNLLADRQGVEGKTRVVRPPMSRRDIADFLDLAPETLSRTFARLMERGQILVSGRTIVLRPEAHTERDRASHAPGAGLLDRRQAQN